MNCSHTWIYPFWNHLHPVGGRRFQPASVLGVGSRLRNPINLRVHRWSVTGRSRVSGTTPMRSALFTTIVREGDATVSDINSFRWKRSIRSGNVVHPADRLIWPSFIVGRIQMEEGTPVIRRDANALPIERYVK